MAARLFNTEEKEARIDIPIHPQTLPKMFVSFIPQRQWQERRNTPLPCVEQFSLRPYIGGLTGDNNTENVHQIIMTRKGLVTCNPHLRVHFYIWKMMYIYYDNCTIINGWLRVTRRLLQRNIQETKINQQKVQFIISFILLSSTPLMRV